MNFISIFKNSITGGLDKRVRSYLVHQIHCYNEDGNKGSHVHYVMITYGGTVLPFVLFISCITSSKSLLHVIFRHKWSFK